MKRLLALTALAVLPAQAGEGAVGAWEAELAKMGARVSVARVRFDPATNTLRLPPETEERAAFAVFLRQEEFVKQLLEAQALTVTQREAAGSRNLIFLNMTRAADWEGHEDAILGHELGHVWLRALGYPSPIYQGTQTACLSIHAGDVVQHVLIRRELERRGIDGAAQTVRTLKKAMREFQAGAELAPCDAIREAALWVDVRLGLPEARWEGRAGFERFMREHFAVLEPAVSDLEGYLRPLDVSDKGVHWEALRWCFERLRAVAVSLLKTNQ